MPIYHCNTRQYTGITKTVQQAIFKGLKYNFHTPNQIMIVFDPSPSMNKVIFFG